MFVWKDENKRKRPGLAHLKTYLNYTSGMSHQVFFFVIYDQMAKLNFDL